MEWWAARGVGVLYNNRTALPRPGSARRRCAGSEAVYLAGVPDYWMDSPDVGAALAGRSAPARPVILMAHQPPQIHAAAAAGVGLQLSGHVHGGQTWPLHVGAWLANPYFSGLSRT